MASQVQCQPTNTSDFLLCIYRKSTKKLSGVGYMKFSANDSRGNCNNDGKSEMGKKLKIGRIWLELFKIFCACESYF